MLTSEQLKIMFEKYRNSFVTFNTDVIRTTGLLIRKVSFKCQGTDNPCILYSCSMTEAKLLVPFNDTLMGDLSMAENKGSIRLVFINPEGKGELPLFIHVEITHSSVYKGGDIPTYFLTAKFKTIPPNDLIEILGTFLDNENSDEKRIHDRIAINSLTQTSLGIQPFESFLIVGHNGKKCILNEISIMSAKVLIHGTPEEYLDKEAILIIKISTLDNKGEMIGKITRADEISRQDKLLSLIIVFEQDKIPAEYKMWIGEYLEALALKRPMEL